MLPLLGSKSKLSRHKNYHSSFPFHSYFLIEGMFLVNTSTRTQLSEKKICFFPVFCFVPFIECEVWNNVIKAVLEFITMSSF